MFPMTTTRKIFWPLLKLEDGVNRIGKWLNHLSYEHKSARTERVRKPTYTLDEVRSFHDTRDSRYENLLRKLSWRLSKHPIHNLVTDIDRRLQLARRGWANVDVWNLGETFTGRLGHQLVHLAETSHGVPGYEPYHANNEIIYVGEGDEKITLYQQELTRYGRALIAYSKHDDLYTAPDFSFKTINEKETELEDAARVALTWVTEHFTTLWD